MDTSQGSMPFSISPFHEVRESPKETAGIHSFVSQPEDFQGFLSSAFVKRASVTTPNGGAISPLHDNLHDSSTGVAFRQEAPRSWKAQFRLYKEEQLLAHPGGDAYHLRASNPPENPEGETGFWNGIAKDIIDALHNAGNFVKDFVWGSEYQYMDGTGHIRSGQRNGLLKNAVNFCKHLVSGLSFGEILSDGDAKPRGIAERVRFAGEKIVGKAFLDDAIYGVPSSALNLLDDAALAVWNLMEVVPDATIGTFPQGQRMVTSLFDNGQVVVDYITDCLPTGDAWMRVHACRFGNEGLVPPVLFNLTLPERYAQDSRWSTIRNTPLRKSIETIGSLLADVGIAAATRYAVRGSKGRE